MCACVCVCAQARMCVCVKQISLFSCFLCPSSESTYLAQGISGCDILAFTESGLYIRFYDLSAGQIEVNGVMILAVEQQVTGMKKVDNVSKRIWCNGGRIRCLRIDPRSESVFIGSSNNAV